MVANPPKDSGYIGSEFMARCKANSGVTLDGITFHGDSRLHNSLYIATDEYERTQRANPDQYVNSSIASCAKRESDLIGADLSALRVVAFCDRPAIEAFIRKYEPAAEARRRDEKQTEQRQREAKTQAFLQTIAQLDTKTEVTLAGVPCPPKA